MDLTLKIAQKTAAYLQDHCEIKFTRTGDDAINPDKAADLQARCDLANQWGADYYISFHINDGGGTGFESYTYNNVDSRTQALRNVIHRKIATVFAKYGLPDRGQQQADFEVLRQTSMSAALFEYGFIDNAKDAGLLKQDSFIDEIAKATAYGLAEGLGIVMEDIELKNAVQKLCCAGVIDSPVYWIENAVSGKTVNGDYTRSLIIKMANKL